MLMNSMVGSDLDVEVGDDITFVDRYDAFVAQGSGSRHVFPFRHRS